MDYKSYLEIYKTHPTPSVVIFKGSIDPITNQNWCSDCTAAEPYLHKIVEPGCNNRGVVYTEVKVGLRSEWVDPKHPLRINPDLKIKSVPTMALIRNGKAVIGLEEEQLCDEEVLKSFLDELN